jgi:hypothetical protein
MLKEMMRRAEIAFEKVNEIFTLSELNGMGINYSDKPPVSIFSEGKRVITMEIRPNEWIIVIYDEADLVVGITKDAAKSEIFKVHVLKGIEY